MMRVARRVLAYSTKRGGGRRPVERDGFGAERFGEPQEIDASIALLLRESQ